MNKELDVVILVLGTNEETNKFFKNEYEVCCKSTWMTELPINWKVIYYQGGDKTELVEDILTLKCEDDLPNTYKKTYLAIDYINRNFKYDYIFRTNTSTYVNIKLLDLFLKHCVDANKYIYGSDIYSLSEAATPYPLFPYIRGNAILMSKPNVEKFLVEGLSLLYMGLTDDIAIGNVMNSIVLKTCLSKGISYSDNHRGIPHAWYRCVQEEFNTGHSLSSFKSSDKYWMCPTITVKKYRDRDNEFSNYRELNYVIKHLEYPNDENIIEAMKNYSDNFDIFIGSILGYVKYEQWLKMDKNKLYLLEITNKASDDEQHWLNKEIQGRFFDFDMDKI